MSNPYAPPKATLAAAAASAFRIALLLRHLAAAGNVLLLLLPVLSLFAPERPQLVGLGILSAATFVVCGTSLLALLSRIGGSVAFWSALALNAGAAGFLVYVFDFRGAEPSDWMAMLLLIGPLGLNILALPLLRLKPR